MHRDLFSAARGLRADLDAVDWASTPLGPIDAWSPTLRNSVDLMLHSSFPMTLLWGEQFALVYNDAYAPMIGDKHPAALGEPAESVFPEAWPVIGPMMAEVARTGVAHEMNDELLPLDRRGFLEDCWFTFSYSAVRGSEGVIEGVIDVTAETTASVKGRRRFEMLARLSDALADASTVAAVRYRALDVMRGHEDDFGAADVRLPETEPADWAPDLPSAAPEGLADGGLVIEDDGGDGVVDDRIAWVALETDGTDQPTSNLVVRLAPRVLLDDELRDTITVTAAIVARAIGRVRADDVAREHLHLERQFSEALQRSLLTTPVQLDDLQIAVRYVPAALEAHVGGDWYDSFVQPHGTVSLVIGDVTGHDREAAASMAQMRNLLRGVSMTLQASPATVLASLERTLGRLYIDVVATGILAEIERCEDGAAAPWRLRWSNAGHPSPALVAPGGSVVLLHREPDPLLGVGLFERSDHEVAIAAGTTIVFYTDGLIERRGQTLDEGFAWLSDVLAGQQHLDAEAVCDLLIEQMPPGVDDDVALLVLKV